MSDANGTRFHLLLGRADWARCWVPGHGAEFAGNHVDWDPRRDEVTLYREVLRFPPTGEPRLTWQDRRGAARDAFGNWYWIAPDRASIQVLSVGSGGTSTFWPPEAREPAGPPPAGAFSAASAPVPESSALQGLTVTEDHYLVAGTTDPGGLLVFDLYAGGVPRRRTWSVPFEPFELVPRAGGGVWVLDRTHARVWELDRRLDVVPAPATAGDALPEPTFRPDPAAGRDDLARRPPLHARQAWAAAAPDPMGIAALPGGGVLVLDGAGAHDFARIYLLEDGRQLGQPASTSGIADEIVVGPGEGAFTLEGYAMAVASPLPDDPPSWLGRLFVVGSDGNQAYAFGLRREGDELVLEPQPEYYPLRLFRGRALTCAGGVPWYDSEGLWVKLLQQPRPRFVDEGELWTPVFDGAEPGCVWHRLMLDGCIPATTAVEVYSRAADTLDERGELPAWQREPDPYLRGNGSELPYVPVQSGPGRGTWELLFQQARGRYLQLRLVLRGDGRSTPRLRALRAWYPRFSYLERYLPAVYREEATSASFLDRFLANIEGMSTGIEDRIAAAQLLFDVSSAPGEALDWLAAWFGVALDPSWDDARRRLFIRHAPEFFAARGTVRGLQLALRLALDECVDDRLFARPGRAARGAAPVRIVERFRTRRTPGPLVGDVGTAVPGPALPDPGAAWRPARGREELERRYRERLALPAGTAFPLVEEGTRWSEFAQETLGFVPSAGAAERESWRGWLRAKYARAEDAAAVQGTAWTSFGEVQLPRAPTGAALADWRLFLEQRPSRTRRYWRDFLARRYRNAGALNAAWRAAWERIADVPLPDVLPAEGAPLADWFQFEGTVMSMHARAHRFTVMLPVPRHLRSDSTAQGRRLARARAVLELEKPAHTSYDLRFYWAMFRLGEARLGDDTLLDLGSRSPELMAPLVLGEGYLSEAFLAAKPGRDAPARVQIGRDRLGCSTRLGGP